MSGREASRPPFPTGTPLVAVLERKGRFLTATPFFGPGRRINVDRARDVPPGELVLVSAQRSGQAKVIRRLGRPDVARNVIEALMLDRGLRRRFDPLVEREAGEAAESPPGAEPGSRTDLRSLPTFTIDPPTAKDYDDAISAEAADDGTVRVWVHIADVAAHVRPGSAVDREAHRRATSTYVPGAVEPMLPEALSNQACSLVPHQDRLAVTVEMDFTGSQLRRSAFHRSVIRSDMRLSYPDVDAIFAGQRQAEDPWAQPLAAARAVASALEDARRAKGALAVESVEPEFAFSREGHVSRLERVEPTESHRLIEHLMIAANEAVAALLETRKIPTLYRIHEQPEPLRIEHLVDQLVSLDVPTPPVPQKLSPSQAMELAGEISRRVDEHVRACGRGRLGLTSLVLRSLKQARYSPRNAGHAGLRSPRYCHFTSPIRRYPDLVCHRALLSALGHDEVAPQANRLEEDGEWCSQRERAAMVIERTADDIARCFLLEAELFRDGTDRVWEGEVVGVIGAGAFVAFGDGHEGLLPVRRLRGDWWELNELETMLLGSQAGNRLGIGDPVLVRVERVDTPRGRVELSPAGE